ncbi:MAG TPA: hypothetical protein VNV86_05295 [Candidatus Acidoferrum sp.]|nr:hypothetical protein [Candidatus Acidoferrum sp.]
MDRREKWLYFAGGMVLGLVVSKLSCPCDRKKRPDPSGPKRPKSKDPCLAVPRPVYRRPDPLIYDQYFLMKQGIAVTWDNPDIHVEQGGVPVPQHQLKPDTDYEVVARIWNGSVDAPAVNMPVEFSYLDFGIGGKSVFIGTTSVDLSVKGGPMCPAFTKIGWRTPARAGHYCLQVRLIWSDDANPDNNLGQSNTDVKALNSPRAQFTFPLRNQTRIDQRFELRADGYRLPAPAPCQDGARGDAPAISKEEAARKMREVLARQGYANQQLPAGWRVTIAPREVMLRGDEETQVTVDIESPDRFAGEMTFNVNAFAGAALAGGVTLKVTGNGE